MMCSELYFSMAVPYLADSCNYFVYALKPCPFNWHEGQSCTLLWFVVSVPIDIDCRLACSGLGFNKEK